MNREESTEGLHPRAQELNRGLADTPVPHMFSALGVRLYMPRSLMIQAQEAGRHAHRINASVGMAFAGGEPLLLPSLQRLLPGLDPGEIVSYSPPAGIPELRGLWREHLLQANPSVSPEAISLPVVVPGLTYGVSAAADMFVDPGDPVIIPEPFWPNYRLIFADRRQAAIEGCELFDDRGGLNVRALDRAMHRHRDRSRIVVLLSFPHNPSGYSPLAGEAADLVEVLTARARTGVHVVCVLDDAYTGLWYEDDLLRESLFGLLSAAHPNLLAIKVDGATKEELVWGFRIGFTSYGSRGLTPEHYAILEEKLTGNIRSTLSSSNTLAQRLLLRVFADPDHHREKELVHQMLRARYHRCRQLLRDSLPAGIRPLPFNSGYFFTLRLDRAIANDVRLTLLHERGIGIVAIDDRHLRVAYSSVDVDDLEGLVQGIADAWDSAR